jgi:hypothetical protein
MLSAEQQRVLAFSESSLEAVCDEMQSVEMSSVGVVRFPFPRDALINLVILMEHLWWM